MHVYWLFHTLNAGTFGKVYKGVYTKDKERLEVAIKTLRGTKHKYHFSCKLMTINI